jgi:3-isopropylmalate/(R)-2-methylmalate dehydratase small subunit
MEDLKREKITGRAIPVHGNDIDTDRIIPARYLKCVVFDGLGEHSFEDDRSQMKEKGLTHPFDDPKYADASLLLVNKNFGCGSSREHAPQAIMRWGKGIKAVVGESFAEIFFGNCVALGVPCVVVDEEGIHKLMWTAESDPTAAFTVDLENKQGLFAGDNGEGAVDFEIPDGVRDQFMKGTWDTTAELLAAKPEIAATATGLPYFNGWK